MSPPRSTTFLCESPSSISSIDSVNDKVNVTLATVRNYINGPHEIFETPNNCIINSIMQISHFLNDCDRVQYSGVPYVVVKNHLLCPFCRIRIMHKKDNNVSCKCGSNFESRCHRIDISNGIANMTTSHEASCCYNSIDFIIFDNQLILYCTSCDFVKKVL